MAHLEITEEKDVTEEKQLGCRYRLMRLTDDRTQIAFDSLEEILMTGFSGTLWCTASSLIVELSIVSMLRDDTGWPGSSNKHRTQRCYDLNGYVNIFVR